MQTFREIMDTNKLVVSEVTSMRRAKKISWFHSGRRYEAKTPGCVSYEIDSSELESAILLVELIVQIEFRMQMELCNVDMIFDNEIQLDHRKPNNRKRFVSNGTINKSSCIRINAEQLIAPQTCWIDEHEKDRVYISGFVGNGTAMFHDAVLDLYNDFVKNDKSRPMVR
eukprot:432422_1